MNMEKRHKKPEDLAWHETPGKYGMSMAEQHTIRQRMNENSVTKYTQEVFKGSGKTRGKG